MITWVRKQQANAEEGAALLITLVMLALLTALTLTLAVITTDNLKSARSATQAGSALNASDAGLAQAVTYLRTTGPKAINDCTALYANTACPITQWGSKDNPQRVLINNRPDQSYTVWIEAVAPYPATKPGIYRAYSKGVAGGPAGRTATADIFLDAIPVPIGIFAKQVNGGGTGDVHYQSIFTTGCVYKRDKITFDGIDRQYGIPAAVHSTQTITTSQGNSPTCPATGSIHTPSQPCNTAYPYDQSVRGGDLSGSPCFERQFNGVTYSLNGQPYPRTSKIVDEADLLNQFGIKQSNLTQSQVEAMKTVAISQNNYHTAATGWTAPTDAHSVLFFDLSNTTPGALVDLNNLSPTWSRPANIGTGSASCQDRSLIVIIQDGRARLNSNSTVFASLFMVGSAAYGQVEKANGTSTWIGTISSNSLDLTGTADMWLDDCFLAHTSPSLYQTTVRNYREVDR